MNFYWASKKGFTMFWRCKAESLTCLWLVLFTSWIRHNLFCNWVNTIETHRKRLSGLMLGSDEGWASSQTLFFRTFAHILMISRESSKCYCWVVKPKGGMWSNLILFCIGRMSPRALHSCCSRFCTLDKKKYKELKSLSYKYKNKNKNRSRMQVNKKNRRMNNFYTILN